MQHGLHSVLTAAWLVTSIPGLPIASLAQTGTAPRGSPPGATAAGSPGATTTGATSGGTGAAQPLASGPLAFPPRRDYRTGRTVHASYDKFADTTTLTAALPLTGVWEALVRPMVAMDLRAIFEGRAPAIAPATVHMVVHVSTWAADAARATADSTRLVSTMVIFVVDDSDRMRLPVVPSEAARFGADTTRMRRIEVDETADVPIAIFLRLANARRIVDAKAGQVVFSIKDDELNALRDFASRLAPAP